MQGTKMIAECPTDLRKLFRLRVQPSHERLPGLRNRSPNKFRKFAAYLDQPRTKIQVLATIQLRAVRSRRLVIQTATRCTISRTEAMMMFHQMHRRADKSTTISDQRGMQPIVRHAMYLLSVIRQIVYFRCFQLNASANFKSS